LWKLIRVIQFRDRDRICCGGLTVSQGHALELIAQAPRMRLTDLAARLRLDKSNATRIAAALEDIGYVRRDRDADDGRAVAVSLTPRGRRAHAELRELLSRDNEQLVAELSAAERASVTRVLSRLADLLDRRAAAPLEAPRGPGSAEEAR
jgi:DNA-binding MarR family transcriptional regulator